MQHPASGPTRPSRRAPLLLMALLAGALAIPGVVAAATVESLAALAETYGLSCQPPAGGEVECFGSTREPPTNRLVLVRPEKGAHEELHVFVEPLQGATPLDASSMAFASEMHEHACGAPSGVASFVAKVGGLTAAADVPSETHGSCRFSGSYNVPATGARPYYLVSSVAVAPPSPGPTASPSIKPSASPTSKPTAVPTAGATAGPTTEPTASPTPAASADPTPAATPAPESVGPTLVPPGPSPAAGGGPTAGPAEPAATDSPAVTPAPSRPTFEGAVVGISQVNGDGSAIAGSLLVALLVLLMIGFIGELFNNTVEANDDVIAGWLRKGPLGRMQGVINRIRIDLPGRAGVLLFIALTALISSFVDPGFGLDVRSIAVFLGFLVGLVVVLASFRLPPILARRRRTGELGQLKPMPWALVIAVAFVLVSRIADLQPGYLYGIVLGLLFAGEASARDEGRETFLGLLWTLAAALLAWIGLTWLRGLGLPAEGFGVTLLSTALAATMVAGLEAAAFALMPLRFMPGYAIYRWNRPAWAALWGVSLFAFVHVLIGPSSGYASELSPGAFLAALGVFAAVGALSIGTWLYFRFRRPPVPGEAAAG